MGTGANAVMYNHKLEYYRYLYRKNGFFWNAHLEDLVAEYGGRKISYPHPRGAGDCVAMFCGEDDVELGFSHYEDLSRHLGERLAYIGHCHAAHVDLLLTESGRLVGYADGLWLRWGDPAQSWKESLQRLLNGEPESVFMRPEE